MKRSTIIFLTMLLSPSVSADLSEQLEICAALEDAESRLACFDAIGRNAPVATPRGDEADKPVPKAGTRDPKHAADMKAPDAPAAPGRSAAAEDVDMDSTTDRQREAMERRREEERHAEAERKLSEKERKQLEKERRQAEKAAKKAERDKVLVATIRSAAKRPDGRFTVVLDNGQVWEETSGSKVGIPPEGARVEVKRGLFGSYRMNIDGFYQTAWVRRKD